MDLLIKLTVPNYVYQFYQQASAGVANCSAEDIMSDALSAYAGLLNKDMAKKRQERMEKNDE